MRAGRSASSPSILASTALASGSSPARHSADSSKAVIVTRQGPFQKFR